MNKQEALSLIKHIQFVKSGGMTPAYREGFLSSYFDAAMASKSVMEKLATRTGIPEATIKAAMLKKALAAARVLAPLARKAVLKQAPAIAGKAARRAAATAAKAAPAAPAAVAHPGGGGILAPLAIGAGLAYAPDVIRWGANKLGYGNQGGLSGPGMERFGGMSSKSMSDFQRMAARMALVNAQSEAVMNQLRRAMNPGGGGTPFTGA